MYADCCERQIDTVAKGFEIKGGRVGHDQLIVNNRKKIGIPASDKNISHITVRIACCDGQDRTIEGRMLVN